MSDKNPPLPYRAVVFGATSAIAGEILRSLVSERRAEIVLVARNADRLSDVAADLRCRGAVVRTVVADLCDPVQVWDALSGDGHRDLFLIAHGSLPDQAAALADPAAIGREIEVNFTSPVRIAAACARAIERQGGGTLALIGSVAGDRGRRSNYLYGSAKAALETFASGLRHRLAPIPAARVVLLKPGMTDTPMTAGMPKGPLFSSSATVGRLGWRAIRKGKPVAYLPGWWRIVMFVVRSLPTPVFHRTNL
jgi:short-subunit dehydrogenase